MKILKSLEGNYVELDLMLMTETDRAIMVGDSKTMAWLLKSQLEDDPELLENGMVRVIIPEWLGREKELI